jgi:glutamyl-Q tRNA(Asp) synthetase
VDRARELPGAADSILHVLETFGLYWDGPVVRQSSRSEFYAAALDRLRGDGLVYECSCTRGDIPPGPPGTEPRYPGTCATGPRRHGVPTAVRFRASAFPGPVTAVDRLQGTLSQDVAATLGDFVLRRRDGYWAYQLAVVVDDAAQGITDVVRGLDLWDNTPRQRLLQRALALPVPRYLHLPLIVEPTGEKLAKSRRSAPVHPEEAARTLSAILEALRLPLPLDLRAAPPSEQLAWAVPNWRADGLAGLRNVPVWQGLPKRPPGV